MRDYSQNSFLYIVRFFFDICKRVWTTVLELTTAKEKNSTGILYSMLHHVVHTGPQSLRRHPTGISLGKAIFSPFTFLISHEKNHENTEK